MYQLNIYLFVTDNFYRMIHPLADDSSANQEREDFLFAEHIRYVLDDPISSLITNMALGLVLCFLLGPLFNKNILLIWIVSLLSVCIGRVFIAWFYSRYYEKISPHTWFKLYFAGTELSAIVWSSTAVFFFPSDSFVSQTYLVAVLAGLIHGAGHSQAPFRFVHILYGFTIMIPIILRFFSMGTMYYGTFAFVLIFLFVGITVSTRRMHRILMESLELRYKMSQMAHIDSLTGVANRRHFDNFLYQEWRRAQRGRWPIAMLMVDVDFFKLYNDIYGHQHGDQCLRDIAEAINKSIHRPSDLVARYGGEEFAVILPNTPVNGAMIVAEEIRQAVASLFIEHSKSTVAHYVTVSLGVAVIQPGQDNHLNELVHAADEALYKAKDSGRNQFSVYLNDPEEESGRISGIDG
jgi:diguanylate cyclase (GGDEF)-like protein